MKTKLRAVVVIGIAVMSGLMFFNVTRSSPSGESSGQQRSATSVSTNLDNFTISSYKIDYLLAKDADNRSTLKTVETITAEFPDYDQNHGIIKFIPTRYDGHSTSVKVHAVSDESGHELPYSISTNDDHDVLRIGDKDTFVHGTTTYIITYTQRDVTKYFANTDDDEFYWDTSGIQSSVAIDKLTVSLRLDESLKNAVTDKTACYQGASGSSDACTLTRQDNSVYMASAENLRAQQNMTIVLGFKPHTFAGHQSSVGERIFGVLLIMWVVLLIASVGVVVWLVVRWRRWSLRLKEVGTIIPEYIPPREASVTTSASIIGSSTKTFAAQLVDFAVRHYVKISEIDKKWVFGSKDYEIEIIRGTITLQPEEQEILRDIFLGDTKVGARLRMSSLKNNNRVSVSMLDNDQKLKELVRGVYGLRTKDEAKSAWFKRAGWTLIVLGIVLVNPILLFCGIGAFVGAATLYPFTDKGLELYRYLEGLKLYIGVAEAERLKLLQSPDGAEKVGTLDPDDPKQMVKLYERVLPYAILFGQETEWNKRLGIYYESIGVQPDWYSSNGVFTAAAFSSALSSFATTSSYTAASSSSSSDGGSSGGGFSGGGGGGGGVGGW